MYKTFLLLLLIALVFASCECPPNLNTPKEFNPSESSNVCFINLLELEKELQVTSLNLVFFRLIPQTNTSYQNYIKFPAGIVDLKIKDNDKILFNTILETKRNNFYTIVFFQKNSFIEKILINEQIDTNNINLYLRIANFSDYSKLKIVLKSELSQKLEYYLNDMSFTDLIAFPSIPFSIEIYSVSNDTPMYQTPPLLFTQGNVVYLVISNKNQKMGILQYINKY